MLTTGAVYRQPETNPGGSSLSRQSRTSPRRSIQSGGSAGTRDSSRPASDRIPVAGSFSRSRSTSRLVRAHSRIRWAGPAMTGPQTAPAAADVDAPGGAAVRIPTRRPDSARQMAVVRPTTPAPITRTSSSLPPMPPDVSGGGLSPEAARDGPGSAHFRRWDFDTAASTYSLGTEPQPRLPGLLPRGRVDRDQTTQLASA